MKRIGVLAGAFNPVTRAHEALARAARAHCDEIVAVLPREFPHKHFHGATLVERREMIERSGIADRVEVAASGLFIDIARELRREGEDIAIICGADAAERVISWDYGEAGAIDRMLDEFSLLVAPRATFFEPPVHLRHRIGALEVEPGFEDVSSTEVRKRIIAGDAWEHLVPGRVVDLVRRIY